MHKLSVCIPFHNATSYIEYCLSSILSQSFKDIEIICVCDNCKNNDHRLIDDYFKDKGVDYKIVDCNVNNVGLARNVALELVNSEYVYMMDSDDKLTDDTFFETFISELDNDKSLMFVKMSHFDQTDGTTLNVWCIYTSIFRWSMIKGIRFGMQFPAEDLIYFNTLKNLPTYKYKEIDKSYYLYTKGRDGSVMNLLFPF